jgi:hypothetical protein
MYTYFMIYIYIHEHRRIYIYIDSFGWVVPNNQIKPAGCSMPPGLLTLGRIGDAAACTVALGCSKAQRRPWGYQWTHN